MKPEPTWKHRLDLRAGDWVEVRSKDAILSTLDANGRLEELPFMPEMFAYCGKRFQIWKRAHKTCDTVNKTGGRSMMAAVHLDEVRCNGEAHGGCQAACLIFWKEAWLERVQGPETSPRLNGASSGGESVPNDRGPTERDVRAAVCAPGDQGDTDPTYICQATLLPQATTGIAATAIFCLIFAWNEYAFAVLLTSGEAQTAPPFIPIIIGEGGQD